MKINITTAELERRRKRVENVHNFIKNDYPAMICFVDIFQYLWMKGIECEDYINDVKTHIECQLDFQKYLLEEFATDQYSINPTIDMFVARLPNAYGSNIRYIKGSLPWTDPWIKDEKDLLKLEKLDVANNGLFLKAKEFRKYAVENARKYPVELADGNMFYPLEGMSMPKFDCDGAFSIAQLLVGMEELFVECYERPEFVHKLLDIITEKYIEHWKDLVKEFDVSPDEIKSMFLADDSATYLNPDMFDEFCVPYMKRIRDTFPKAQADFHLCRTVPEYVRRFMDKVDIRSFMGFKPNAGINSVYESYKPVNDMFGNKLVIYPDTDPCVVETASNEAVYQEVMDMLRAFEGSNGVCISFSTWSAEKSKYGMKACMDYTGVK